MSCAPSETFSTECVAAARRLRFWNEVATSTFGDIAVAPLAQAFSARLLRLRLGRVMLADVTSSAAQVRGGESAATRRRGWFLLLNEAGASRAWQSGHAVELGAGDLTVLGTDIPWRIEFRGSNRTRVLHLPPEAADLALEACIARRITGDEGRLMTALIRRLERGGGSTSASTAQAGRLVLDAARLCWPAAARTRHRAMQSWIERLTHHVAEHHDDPELGPTLLAHRFGISLRFVHLVFARSGRTAEASILEHRLAAAALRLRATPGARITDLALDCGFTDLSHFCHAFRRRYGMSASDWRRSATHN